MYVRTVHKPIQCSPPLLCSFVRLRNLVQVIEITCADSKAVYDEVKSKKGHPVLGDIAGADVSGVEMNLIGIVLMHDDPSAS